MITILTPTYNRGYILSCAYESLCCQTSKEFEWIIVDDGSTDDTENLVKKWIHTNNDFTIRYYKKINGGKHRAINFGVLEANGDFIFILDSDDCLTKGAIEFFIKHLAEIESDAYVGLAGLKAWKNKSGIIGKQKENERYIDATNIERTKYKLLGDKAEIYKKDIMLKYPFPEFEGEKFIAESSVWDRIALDGYKIRWYNHVVYKGDYLNDGLSKSGNLKYANNFEGFTYTTKLQLQYTKFPYKLMKIGHYVWVAKEKGLAIKVISEKIQITPFQLHIGLMFFILRNIYKNFRNGEKITDEK